jgi:hypothetical protein
MHGGNESAEEVQHPYVAALTDAPIADASKRQYKRNLMLVQDMTGKPLERIVSEPKSTWDDIQRTHDNPNTRKAMVAAIKALFRYVPGLKIADLAAAEQWHEIFKAIDGEITQRVMHAQPTERERKNWVEWSTVQKVLKREEEKDFASDDHLLLSMYTRMEPLRQDYGHVRIVRRVSETGDGENYLLLGPERPMPRTATLVLRQYKTCRSQGEYSRDVPPVVVSVIMANLVRKPRKYLFVDTTSKPYKSNMVFANYSNRTLMRLFGGEKRVTVSLLRHSFISAIDFNEATPAQLLKTSEHMAHSLNMQQLYRRRVPTEGQAVPTEGQEPWAAAISVSPTLTKRAPMAPMAPGPVMKDKGVRYIVV